MPTPLIEFDGVTKIYRKGFTARKVPAVVDLSLAVQQQCITGFVGPNGAGKTTSIKMLLGLVRPTSGTIRLRGTDTSQPAARRGVACVSEQPYFYEYLTPEEALAFAYRLGKQAPARINDEIGRVLDKVDLERARKKRVNAMSKGMQQRLSLARALLGSPDAFIMDEPMSGLDPPGRALFREIFKELAAGGASIFFSSHILDDVESLCEDVIVLSNGRLTYRGAVASLLEKGAGGTEIVAESVGEDLIARLKDLGCSVRGGPKSEVHVFVPPEADTAACTKLLCSGDAYCKSISPFRKSLEELLYGPGGVRGSEGTTGL